MAAASKPPSDGAGERVAESVPSVPSRRPIELPLHDITQGGTRQEAMLRARADPDRKMSARARKFLARAKQLNGPRSAARHVGWGGTAHGFCSVTRVPKEAKRQPKMVYNGMVMLIDEDQVV